MSKFHHTRNNISLDIRKQIVDLLNKSLADTVDLHAMLKNAHWNIKGSQFIALHKLFDELASELLMHIDTIAERTTSLGGTAHGTLQQAVSSSSLEPYPTNIFDAEDHLNALAARFATIGQATRICIDKTNQLNDMATNDLYIDLARYLDKSLWFIEAHLQ